MVFRIEIADPAIRDIEEAFNYIAQDSVDAALKWQQGLWRHIRSLNEIPTRYMVIPEAEALGFGYRSIVHYSHRIIYRVNQENKIVHIVRVYHGARKPLNQEDIA